MNAPVLFGYTLDGPLNAVTAEALDALERWGSIEQLSRGRHSRQTMLDAVYFGLRQLWLARADGGSVAGIAVTEDITYGTGLRVCNVMLLGGEDMAGWGHLVEGIKDWAKGRGCSRIEAWGRPGLSRALKWPVREVFMEQEL